MDTSSLKNETNSQKKSGHIGVSPNLIDFIFEFGEQWMMWVVREKATGKMVANGYVDEVSLKATRGGTMLGHTI